MKIKDKHMYILGLIGAILTLIGSVVDNNISAIIGWSLAIIYGARLTVYEIEIEQKENKQSN